ncbi:MAG: tRNA (adenosine(37)-N6)-threonylcarbamoyltransferase complex ATPase subunit type 1 TsaE, partial [Kiritimatiellia bacterium]
TCFVQGMAEGLGWEGAVTSPTFGLVQEFRTHPRLIHADLYRLEDPAEIWSLGLDEWLEEEAVLAVEWSERVKNFWPADAWQVEILISPRDCDHREIRISREEAL